MARLSLALLGSPKILLDGEPVTAFKTQKVLALLAFLAVEAAHPHRREALCGLLWPDQTDASARDNLRVTLYRLRQTLHEDAQAPFLEATRDAAQFNPRSDHWLDLADFNALITECRNHAHERMETCAECSLRLTKAVDLYRGDFLQGISLADSTAFEEWVLVQREALRRQVLSASEILSAYHEQRGDYEALSREAHRQLALEPWHEPAHRQLMRGLALSGDRNAALAQYEACRRVLAQELGIEPEAETHALAERIRAGELSPVALTAQPPPHNLPAHLTPFVGRESELAEIAAQLQQPGVRLLTLIGAGGMGKTRLAVEAAQARLNDYPHGVFFVSLAALTQPSQIAPAIAATIGLPPTPGNPINVLQAALRTKRVLLVLDNLEHLLAHPLGDGEPGCAALIVQILEAAPQVRVLATSRELLNVRGERVVNLQGMPLAGESFVEMSYAPPVRLFVQSAHLGQPTFKLTEDNAHQIARICRLVQGMPLGLELAAACVGVLSLSDIANEIARSADFLAQDWPDVPTRQRSMRAVFDWSWQLLNETEQRVLQQLSIFQGGCTRKAAEAVTGATWQMLARLTRKSLVRQTSTDRYDMHELVRHFAMARLDASGERGAVMARHSTWFLTYVAAHTHRLVRNEPSEAAAEIMVELDNVRQAWMWAAEQAQVQALRGAAYGLWQFYLTKGYFAEGERMFALVVAGVADVSSSASAYLLSRCLAAQAQFMNSQTHYTPALLMAQRAMTIGIQWDDRLGEALGYLRLGHALTRTGKIAEASPHFDQALSLVHLVEGAEGDTPDDVLAKQDVVWETQLWQAVLIGDQFPTQAAQVAVETLSFCRGHNILYGQLRCMLDLIEYFMDSGNDIAAEAYLDEVQTLSLRASHIVVDVSLVNYRGALHAIRDEYSLATAMFERALEITQTYTDELDPLRNYAILSLGQLADMLGNYAAARSWLERGLRLSQTMNNRYQEMIGERYFTLLALRTNTPAEAVTHAKNGLRLAQEQSAYNEEAICTTLLGRALEESGQLDEALVQLEHARSLFASLPRPYFAVEPLASLARVALARGDLAGALAYIEATLIFLAAEPCTGLNEPFLVFLSCVRVLQALGDKRADEVLHTAHARLHECADRITDDALRSSFLENVATHRELRRAFAEMGVTKHSII